MHVCGDLELYRPLIIWVLTFSTILVDLEHQPKLEWHLVSILFFLQTVMVKIILQKIYMQHFSIKWFDIPNLHLVSIILPSKDIKKYFACFSFGTINHKAHIKQIAGSLSKWPKTLLTLHSLSFLFLCILGVHLSLWQIIKHLFQTSPFWNMKIYSKKFSWMCCTLWSSATKHDRQFCLIKWIGLLTSCYCNLQ